MNDKKFVTFIEGEKNGCNFYRIRQPYEFLQERENYLCGSTAELKSIDNINMWMSKSSIVVSQNAMSKRFLQVMKEAGREKYHLDFDDNLFAVSPYNPAYRLHGTSDVEITEKDGNKVMLWKDKEKGFNIEENVARQETFIEVLKHADIVTTPSPILASLFRDYGAKNTKVIKNFLDFKVWSPLDIRKDEFVRIGYQGGWSHYEDWHLIESVLIGIMKKYANVKLVLMGQTYKGILKKLPADRIEVHDWTSIDAYPHKFKTLNIDIGICPLANTPFNVCKSEIKWEEYSALKIPTVASDVPPYNTVIDHNKTGFLAKNEDEWIHQLSTLIDRKELRENIGEVACKYVRENYDIRKEVYQYEDVFKNLLLKDLVIV